jgi:uncharacterized protein (DUF1501 family)
MFPLPLPARSPDHSAKGLSRRRFLHASGLGALGLLWADWRRAEAAGAADGTGKAKAVILIFNCGAPSHLDLWDPKPEAPDSVRGLFHPIATSVPGVRVSELLPGFTALLDDLEERGLLESTLVVWMGDFGRTPLINKAAGRDHWPGCYSMVLAGGGIRGGQVVGVSDRVGAYPNDYPVTPADVHATVFRALGYDPHAITYQSPEARPLPLSEGEPIRALLG